MIDREYWLHSWNNRLEDTAMLKEKPEMTREYQEGYDAYNEGKRVEQNPYPAYSAPRLNWDRGWRKGKMTAKTENEEM